MPMMNDRQYRSMVLQTRAKEDSEEKSYEVEGYATTWERYLLFDGEREQDKIYEQFSADCFKDCDMSDVIFQYNHQGDVYARQSNGTLNLSLDDHGLKVEADLGLTEKSRQMHEQIATGLVTKMSWGFIPQEYHYNEKTQTIVHTKVKKIFDVSAVSIPANDTTDINARSFADGVIQRMLEEVQRAKRSKIENELELKLKLAGF